MFTVACLKAFDLYSGWLVCLVINAITGKRIRTHTHHGHTHICAYGSGENVKVTGLFPNSLAWQRLQPPVSCIYIRYVFAYCPGKFADCFWDSFYSKNFLTFTFHLSFCSCPTRLPPLGHTPTLTRRERDAQVERV